MSRKPVILYLSKALLCIAGTCHPVLVGDQTPTGTFRVVEHVMPDGQRVLAFARTRQGSVYAIHLAPTAHRRRLLAGDARTGVTAGCINVDEQTYRRAKWQRKLTIR